MSKIITISREYGSGGKYIGELVAQKLGIPFYDKEIMEKIAEETGFVSEFIEKLAEYAPSKSIFAYAFVGRNQAGESVEDYIHNVQRKIILELAEKGDCVFVGRSADYILQGKHELLNVFIHGDTAAKKERVCRFHGVIPSDAEKLMRETDKKRSINYRYYTGETWGEAKNYTLTLNSTKIGVENCADIIAGIYNNM
ncbi:MAG: cytidylate kinase-like family protein [Clostridia bacterium]|nr:cytidylate kinase-like family protein [Clostridia bacterium]MBQ8863010.1 cytidylate kinase-like family protein [Clostridia bacterium]